MTDQVELVQNAAGRMVPAMVNGKPAIPYLGVGKYQPRGRKAAPPVRSSKDYPEGGDKRVADLERSLAQQMTLTDQQRLRADLAEASCHRAWTIAAIGGRVPTPVRQ